MIEMTFFIWLVFGGVVWLMLTVTSELERPFISALIVLMGLNILQQFTNAHPFTYIYNNPLSLITFVAGYVVAGVVYTYLKWKMYTREILRNFIVWCKPEWDVTSPKVQKSYLESICINNYDPFPLQVKYFKTKLSSWLVYWPVSFVFTLLNDPIRRLFEEVYSMMVRGLQKMSDSTFKDIVKKEETK